MLVLTDQTDPIRNGGAFGLILHRKRFASVTNILRHSINK
jgi:hypothetical protein